MAIVISLAATSSSAFDGNRKGFLLGWGAGVGVLGITGDQDTGANFNLKIGWGISDRLLLYYSGYSGLYEGSIFFAPTAALSYHPFSRAPNLYFTGGFGMSDLGGWEERTEYSNVFLAGAGIEVFRHWSFELSVFNPVSPQGYTIVALTFNVLGY
jgi:hypothetical protein